MVPLSLCEILFFFTWGRFILFFVCRCWFSVSVRFHQSFRILECSVGQLGICPYDGFKGLLPKACVSGFGKRTGLQRCISPSRRIFPSEILLSIAHKVPLNLSSHPIGLWVICRSPQMVGRQMFSDSFHRHVQEVCSSIGEDGVRWSEL